MEAPNRPGLWPARTDDGERVVVVHIFESPDGDLLCGRQLDPTGWGPTLPQHGVNLPPGWSWGEEVTP